MYFLFLSATHPGPPFVGCNFGQYIMRHHRNISPSALLPGSGELDDFDSSPSGSNVDAGELLQGDAQLLSVQWCTEDEYNVVCFTKLKRIVYNFAACFRNIFRKHPPSPIP